jgi:hypothetical protein
LPITVNHHQFLPQQASCQVLQRWATRGICLFFILPLQ